MAQFQMPFGMFYAPDDFAFFGTGPMPHGHFAESGGFIAKLNTCRTKGVRVVIRVTGGIANFQNVAGDPELISSNPLFDPTARIGGYCARRHKQRITDAFNRANSDVGGSGGAAAMASFVADGTLIAHSLCDDFLPGAWANLWAGKGPTLEELDAAAKHSKGLWPAVPTSVRGDNNYLGTKATPFKDLDMGWSQAVFRLGTGVTFAERVRSYFRDTINNGRKVGLGTMLGFNLLNGGAGTEPGWAQHPDRSPVFGMSPAEIMACADAAASRPDAIGFIGWEHRSPGTGTTAYFDNPAIQAALEYARAALLGKKSGPTNRRDA